MIGSKEQESALYDNWTFCDKGFKFFIRKNKNLLKFKLHNVFSGEWYENEEVELQRINEQTIKAAFDPKVSMVSYDLTEKSQNEATLTFKVKMEFLSSEFSEDIHLKKLKINAEQAGKLQLEQLSQQICEAQRMLEQTLRSMDKLIYQTNTNIRTNQNPLFKLKIDAGKYLFELSGFYFTQRLYDEYNGYDQCGDYLYGGVDPQSVERNAAIILSVKLDGVEAMTLTSTRPNYCQAYEYPYSFSFIIEIKETCEVKFDCMDTNKEYLLMNHNNLIIRPI